MKLRDLFIELGIRLNEIQDMEYAEKLDMDFVCDDLNIEFNGNVRFDYEDNEIILEII